ncbi:hypothetical protein DFH06DRAFT_51669 [Mycena polygramma]|nr:hypothetical protein DFH06DRAFT_51669 [Mycena polygramma]
MEAYTERWKDAFQRPLEMVQFPGVVHCADVKAGAEIVPDSLAPSEQRVISQTADFEMAELSISSSGDIDAMEVDCLGTTPSTPTNTAPAIADYKHLAVHRTFCQKCHNGSNTIPEIGHTKKTSNPGAIVWSTCLKCTVAAHWVCLAAKQKANVDTATGSFICSACCHGGVCIVCLGTVPASPPTVHSHATMPSNPPALVFRCLACRRPAHYACVPTVPGLPPFTSATSIAAFYQKGFCADCTTYCYDVDKILAWRAYPPNAVQPSSKDNHPPNDKDPLNREYLVKWQDRSHRRLQWVPHMWFHVQQGTVTKLRNFLRGQVTKAVFREDPSHAPAEQRDAMEAIPVAWKTPERVLRLLLWRHPSSSPPGSRADSDRFATQRALTQKLGWNPSGEFTMNLDEWEKFKKRPFTLNDLDEVAWAYIKWEGLNYDQASWDSPPLPDEPGYRAFQTALARFLKSLGGIPMKSGSTELQELAPCELEDLTLDPTTYQVQPPSYRISLLTLAMVKKQADSFCLKLAGNRHKLVGSKASLFLSHLYRLSAPNGWLPATVIDEWAIHLDNHGSQTDTKVLETNFFHQMRTNARDFVKDHAELELWWKSWIRGTHKWFKVQATRAIVIPIHIPQHWICSLVDFDQKYLAIFDSWERDAVRNTNWQWSYHAGIFELIKEWLQRLFVSLGHHIDWTEWTLDACPVNQPYQVNTFDCGPHTCFMMALLGHRQANDIKHANTIITAQTRLSEWESMRSATLEIEISNIEPHPQCSLRLQRIKR